MNDSEYVDFFLNSSAQCPYCKLLLLIEIVKGRRFIVHPALEDWQCECRVPIKFCPNNAKIFELVGHSGPYAIQVVP
jgi:hypothetical protein